MFCQCCGHVLGWLKHGIPWLNEDPSASFNLGSTAGFTNLAQQCGAEAWPVALQLAQDGAMGGGRPIAESTILLDTFLRAKMKD